MLFFGASWRIDPWLDGSHFEMENEMQLTKAPFTKMLVEANAIHPDDFQCWVFREEMLFKADGKWWGDFGRRDFPHEGIDLCLYADSSGKICRLDEQTRIPVMHDGVVRAVFKDYLGMALIIEHLFEGEHDAPYLSAYAHTVPQKQVQPGTKVKRGDVIATIAGTRTAKAKILPHLHFSFGRPSPKLGYDNFVWNLMRDTDLISLRDPLELIDWPHRVMHIDIAADSELTRAD